MAYKPQIENAVYMGYLVSFEAMFPEEPPKTPEEYLRAGDINHILGVAAFFLGFKSSRSRYKNIANLLGDIFSAENEQFASDVYDRIVAIEEDQQVKAGIINPFSSLTLFDTFFRLEQHEITQSHAEFEVNLFKAYLVLNSQFLVQQKNAFTSTTDLESGFKVPMMMFCMQYPLSDKTSYDIQQIWVAQMIKAIYLFEFLENHPKINRLLQAFIHHFNSATWMEFLRDLVPLTLPAIQQKKEAHTDIIVEKGEKFEESCAFIEKLIANRSDEQLADFISLRSKPLYQVEKGVYRIIFNLFVVEKIFKGVYFLLRDINNQLPKDDKVPGLKSIYGYEFSEQALMYRVIKQIYPGNGIKFSGKQLADQQIDGAPDFYLRNGKIALLVESKDFLIPAEDKMSYDFQVYEESIGKILHYEVQDNGKEKPGAVRQIANTIRKLLCKTFEADKAYHYKDIFIYPVLLTHDHQYDAPGFNVLVDAWFQEELQTLRKAGLFVNRVKPITVVNIDSLIYHQVGLAEELPLHKVLDLYFEHLAARPDPRVIKTEEDYKSFILAKYVPFSLFIDNYFRKKNIGKMPPALEQVAPALFKDQTNGNGGIKNSDT
jgi:hypothetical protein